MISYLHIKNIGLIEEVELEFDEGLNILTGETGAGKSMIIGAFELLFGGRFDRDNIRNKDENSLIEAIFELKKKNYLEEEDSPISFLQKNDIEYFEEDGLLLQLVIKSARSFYRINGTLVNRKIMKELGSYLIDIYSQRQHQSLLLVKNHRLFLDRYSGAKLADHLKTIKNLYGQKRALSHSFDDQMDDDKRLREMDLLDFEINEIEELNILIGEDNELEKEYKKLSSNADILESFQYIERYLLDGSENFDHLSSALRKLSKIRDLDDEISDIMDQFTMVEDIYQSVNRQIISYIDGLDDFEARLAEVEARLDELNRIKMKYRKNLDEILSDLEDKKIRYEELEKFDLIKKEVEEKLSKIQKKLVEEAEIVSQIRLKNSKKMQADIQKSLARLNLKDTVFKVNIEESEISEIGKDKVEFLISTNKGEDLKALAKIASGGEQSRLMLAIKRTLASVDQIESMIFDEIDSGISGVTAVMVAEELFELSKDQQIICITHLSQIASKGKNHLLISKENDGKRTLTKVARLEQEERVKEIARLIAGNKINDNVISLAKEMLNH